MTKVYSTKEGEKVKRPRNNSRPVGMMPRALREEFGNVVKQIKLK